MQSTTDLVLGVTEVIISNKWIIAGVLFVVYCADGVLRKGLLHGKPQLYYKKDDSRMKRILKRVGLLKKRYFPTFWAHSSMIQLGLLTFQKVRHSHTVTLKPHTLQCPDGGEVTVVEYIDNKYHQNLNQDSPVVTILHTITGNERDEVEFGKYALKHGWRPIILCRRGHYSELKLRTPKWNIMGSVDDTKQMINYISSLYPKAFIGACGMSAGSGQIVSYIGSADEDSPVKGAVSLCPAYSIDKAFGNFHNKSPLLAKYILSCLKSHFLVRHEEVLQETPGYHNAMRSSSIDDFVKESITFSGHRSLEDFFEESNPMQHYRKNNIPCLVLNSIDDPLCVERNIPYDIAGDTVNYALIITKAGSHVGYREGLLGESSFMHRLAIEFLQSVKIEHDGM